MKSGNDFDTEKDWLNYLRFYYAGLAMQALLANPERYKYIAGLIDENKVDQQGATIKNAHKAVLIADALIAELNKEKK